MSNTYQVLGTDEVITRGRDEFLQTLLNTKRHISIVAPKYFGKSVVLNEIVRKTVHRSPDTVVFYMDLRKMQRDIDTDEKFFRRFCRGIKESLENTGDQLAEFDASQTDKALKMVEMSSTLSVDDDDIEELEHQIRRLLIKLRKLQVNCLVVMDQFDQILNCKGIKGGLWNVFSALAQDFSSTLRFITASRSPLETLCTTQEQSDSDFWRLFGSSFETLSPLTESDLESWFKPFTDKRLEIESDAKKQYLDWTGGVPLLAAELAQRLWDSSDKIQNKITISEFDSVAEELLKDSTNSVFSMLWKDIPPDSRQDLFRLSKTDLTPDQFIGDAEDLRIRGYVQASNGKFTKSCSLIFKYAQNNEQYVPQLDPLFRAKDNFEKNIAGVISNRIKQIDYDFLELRLRKLINPEKDRSLKQELHKSMQYLQSNPTECLGRIRVIRDLLFRAMWDGETEGQTDGDVYFLAEGSVAQLRNLWPPGKTEPRWLVNKFVSKGARGQQLQALDFLTGHDDIGDNCAVYLSRDTYWAATLCHSASNAGQHDEVDNPTPLVTAITACFSVIAMLELLVRDLTPLKNKDNSIYT